MTLAENISKFSRIVAAHPDKLTPEAINETVRAIIIADTAHRLDEDRGSYEHVGLQELAKSGIKEFSGVCLGQKSWSMDMSAVMQMRVMCDVLTLLLNSDGVDLAMRYSADVAKAMGQRMRTKRVDYLPFDICERILDYYLEDATAFDPELKPVFDRVSYFLGEIKNMQPRVNSSKSVIKKDCVSKLWLPDGYDSHGFDVTRKEPTVISQVNGSKVPHVEAYDYAFIMDVLIKVVVRVDTGDIARYAFVSRLSDLRAVAADSLPVGVDVGSSVREPVYTPRHFLINSAIRELYGECFTVQQKLSESSVSKAILAIKSYYKI